VPDGCFISLRKDTPVKVRSQIEGYVLEGVQAGSYGGPDSNARTFGPREWLVFSGGHSVHSRPGQDAAMELIYASATEQAKAIPEKQISSEELTRACIK